MRDQKRLGEEKILKLLMEFSIPAIVGMLVNTLYNITDDSDVTFALLELLFPIGAVYFGTMSVCPLQTLGVGTWQALPQDKVIQIAGTRGSVGDTLNESLPNITGQFMARPTNNAGGTGVFANSYYNSGFYGASIINNTLITNTWWINDYNGRIGGDSIRCIAR